MKALLIKFNSETDQEVLYEETVMCPETAFIVMNNRHYINGVNYSKLIQKKKKIFKFLSKVKMLNLFADYKDFEDTVHSINIITSIHNNEVTEYYLICTSKGIKNRTIELFNLLKQYKKHEVFFSNACDISYKIDTKETHEMIKYLEFLVDYKDVLNLQRLRNVILNKLDVHVNNCVKGPDLWDADPFKKVLNNLFNLNLNYVSESKKVLEELTFND